MGSLELVECLDIAHLGTHERRGSHPGYTSKCPFGQLNEVAQQRLQQVYP